MFFEKGSHNSREGWTYDYTGAGLLPQAELLLAEWGKAEMDARNAVADLMRDPGVSHNDDRIVNLKRDIERFGKEKEACQVFVSQFKRSLQRVYSLAIGDVVYFRLHL